MFSSCLWSCRVPLPRQGKDFRPYIATIFHRLDVLYTSLNFVTAVLKNTLYYEYNSSEILIFYQERFPYK